MRCAPLFSGTPATPSPTACGSLRPYAFEPEAFPSLGPEQASSSSNPRIPHTGLTFRQMLTKGHNSSLTTPTSSSSMAHTLHCSRRNQQFQNQCATLDSKLEEYQYEGAKLLLATIHPDKQLNIA